MASLVGGAPSPSSSAPWKPHRKALGTCNIITLFLNPVGGKTSDVTPAPEGHSVLDIFLLFSFHFSYAKIKPNIMRITTENGRRTARGTTRGSPLPLVSTQSGKPGDAVDRAGAVLQRRIAFAATPSTSRV